MEEEKVNKQNRPGAISNTDGSRPAFLQLMKPAQQFVDGILFSLSF